MKGKVTIHRVKAAQNPSRAELGVQAVATESPIASLITELTT
jgi:hypothetical protein